MRARRILILSLLLASLLLLNFIPGALALTYEDFTTYTEVDPDPPNRLSISAYRLNFTQVSRLDDVYVYGDKGVDHFGNFEHWVTCQLNYAEAWSSNRIWVLSNAIGDQMTHQGLSEDFIGIVLYRDASLCGIYLQSYSGGALDKSDYLVPIDLNTPFYLRIKRVGVTVTCDIYESESDRDDENNALANLSIDPTFGAIKFRYIYAFHSLSASSGLARPATGWVEYLYLKELCSVHFYFNEGGEFRINNATVTNGSEVVYAKDTVLELASLPKNSSWVFSSFNWAYGENFTNPYNFTVTANATLWLYFDMAGASETWITLAVVGFIGLLAVLAIFLALEKK